MGYGKHVQSLDLLLVIGMFMLVLGVVALLFGGRVYDRTPDGPAWHGRYGRLAVVLGLIVVATAAAGLHWGV